MLLIVGTGLLAGANPLEVVLSEKEEEEAGDEAFHLSVGVADQLARRWAVRGGQKVKEKCLFFWGGKEG